MCIRDRCLGRYKGYDRKRRLYDQRKKVLANVCLVQMCIRDSFRQGQHLRKQALGFQGQVFVPQMVVAHYRVAPVLLHTKNCHFVVNSFHLEFHRVKGGELARLVRYIVVINILSTIC